MKQYIPKTAVVAEIEKRKKNWQYGNSIEAKYKKEECDDILSFLDTIEVKEENSNDVFIEKATEWLSNVSIEDMTYKYGDFDTSENWDKFIEDFRKHMSL